MVLTQLDIEEIERIIDERLDLRFPNLDSKLDRILGTLDSVMGELKTTCFLITRSFS